MNNGFNMSSILGSLEQISRGARAAATRRRARELAKEIEQRGNVRRSSRQAAIREAKSLIANAAANVNIGAAAAASNWGGEGPIYGTNYTVARAANSRDANERPPRAVSRRGRAPSRTRGRNRTYNSNNEQRRKNERSRSRNRGYGNNRRKSYPNRSTRRRNNAPRENIPESEKKESSRHTSILQKAQVVLKTKDETLSSNNSKRHYQIIGYEEKLSLLKEFKRKNPTNVHIDVITEAISILESKLGIRQAAAANVNMSSSSGAAAIPAPKKERTFHTRQLKPIIEKYVAKGQMDKAIPFIQLLSTRTDRTLADNALLEEYRQHIPLPPPTYQATDEEIALLEGLTASIAGLSMGPPALPNNNNL